MYSTDKVSNLQLTLNVHIVIDSSCFSNTWLKINKFTVRFILAFAFYSALLKWLYTVIDPGTFFLTPIYTFLLPMFASC